MLNWFVFAGLTAAVTLGLALQVLRRRQTTAESPQAIAIYRDQLAELERDLAMNRVTKAEAEKIRAEIARRILAEGRPATAAQDGGYAPRRAALLALVVPLIAIPLYLKVGAPDRPDMPLAARLDNAVQQNDMAAMVAKVEKHLAEKPNDVQGWQIIAPVYNRMGRFDDAAYAYSQVIRLSAPAAAQYGDFGEAKVMAAQGMVTADALDAFRKALELDPKDPRARYYDALAARQEGDVNAAITKFQALLNDSPPDAPWRETVQKEISGLARPPALTEEQLANAKAMPAEDQGAMIRSMVDGLESKLTADGNNIEGWLRLIRARTVLGETDRARDALAKANSTFKDQPQELALLAALAKDLKLE